MPYVPRPRHRPGVTITQPDPVGRPPRFAPGPGTPQPTTHHPPSFQPYKPWVAPPVPAGSYDPALDAQRNAANRGLGDLTFDTNLQNQRDTTDYGIQRDQLNLGLGRTAQDIGQQRQLLARSYNLLQQRQGQQINAAGTGYGGAALQAAAKRTANQALDNKPLDLAFSRATEDNQRQLAALALDYAPPSASNPFGGRRFQDRTIALTRGQRENTQFGIDTTAEKAYQATADPSYDPPQGPKNQHTDAQGNPYRTVRRNGWVYQINPDGSVRHRRPA